LRIRRLFHPLPLSPRGWLLGALILAAALGRPHVEAQSASYTVYIDDARHTLPFRTINNVDFVSLDQLAGLFGLTVAEDPVVNGLTIRGRGQQILAIPGQSFASIGPGRVVSLPAAIQRDRGSWMVPVDFIRQAIGPALGLRVDVRRAAHAVLVGDVRLPQVTARVERSAAGARVTFEIQPATPHRVTRENRQLVVRFDAVAVDLAPASGLPGDFATGIRADGTAVFIDLGPSTSSYRADDVDPTHLTIDLIPAGATLPVMPQVQAPATPALPDGGAAAGVRTIVIDPGHGGDDNGVIGPGGTKEKDLVLQMARRLKSTIEGRYGLRVLLTREGDTAVAPDRRTALANNNKADLFISLHANGSVQPEARGAQVLSLNVGDYTGRPEAVSSAELPVPVAGGGTRSVDIVPWDLAQLPFAATSATIAGILTAHLGEHHVALYTKPTVRLPLRTLVGANMPAVMVEVGFLTNAADETALARVESSGAIIDAIADTVRDVRRGLPPAGGRP
jgi:N-acetylmuramoyl-L-alanine amidase